MKIVFAVIVSIIAGYLVGCINPSYIIARMKGFDIRKSGSRNAGGSNAVITMGKVVGAVCIVFDILKAFAIIGIMSALFPEISFIYSVTGVSCIIGHMFPFYMGFKGGKGLACLGGMILAFNWKVFLIMLFIELVLAIVIDYICVVPITASIAYPAVYGVMSGNVVGALIILAATAVMLLKHLENLKRIKQGTELHFSYLWSRNKETEKARIIENVRKIDETQVGTIWREK
ncbi:MAG: glycerol-3-phosphate acyltransferase [Lachnospiraceae bacterium]|nr:glycerol-3-phosphate acyltransferase [Lachnospiraceae bacterium]MBO7634845.1 glycerol-3-phosphate acyltransferase [Lachnospiraceae bacterium]MBP5652547.1 glycerol-3-phosphate acyltransferase [Lachnospiraceae bacterium]